MVDVSMSAHSMRTFGSAHRLLKTLAPVDGQPRTRYLDPDVHAPHKLQLRRANLIPPRLGYSVDAEREHTRDCRAATSDSSTTVVDSPRERTRPSRCSKIAGFPWRPNVPNTMPKLRAPALACLAQPNNSNELQPKRISADHSAASLPQLLSAGQISFLYGHTPPL